MIDRKERLELMDISFKIGYETSLIDAIENIEKSNGKLDFIAKGEVSMQAAIKKFTERSEK